MSGSDRSEGSTALVTQPSGSGERGQESAQRNDGASDEQASVTPLATNQIPGPYKAAVANPHAHTEQPDPYQLRDLKAQEDMAYWAGAMFFAAALTFLVTSLGTLLIWKQVKLTREAVEDTGKATKAMERQNILMAASQRAWLVVEPTIVTARFHKMPDLDSTKDFLQLDWEWKITNVGATVARSVQPTTTFDRVSGDAQPSGASMGWGGHDFNIIPGESIVELAGGIAIPIDIIEWSGDEPHRYVSYALKAVVTYQVEGSEEWHITQRAFGLRLKNDKMTGNPSIYESDLVRISLDNISVTAFGKSISN